MCGILGLIDLREQNSLGAFENALASLKHRGPEHSESFVSSPLAFGHNRLSIIDLDTRSNQPMHSLDGRYTIIFNGEIYNFKELKHECEGLGYSFMTESDTEVLLVIYQHFGQAGLTKLNGCFSFAVFDRADKKVFIARDRFGINPLYYYHDDTTEIFAFSSELRGLMKLGFKRVIDKVSLFTFFKLNYIPAPHTILCDHHKLEPGHCIEITWKDDKVSTKLEKWYDIPYDVESEKPLKAHDYKESQKTLKRFLRESVKRRMVADVPVGTFLSGGVDSSIITALASEVDPSIEAFSIGFKDHPFYDESKQAEAISKHLRVKHHVIDVKEDDMLKSSLELLEHMDEPFADSSAINVSILSKETRKHLKVALSGDGGDELFAGYNKHHAEYRVRNPKYKEHIVGNLGFLWNKLPASRQNGLSNLVRQLQKFSDGYHLQDRDRYWRWAGVLTEEQANYLLKEEMLQRNQRLSDDGFQYKKRKDNLLKSIKKGGTLNDVLLTDVHMVLPNDMLYKVDSSSMMHGLEVRTPLLDHHVVKHAFKLPVMYKVNDHDSKKILKDTFRDLFPSGTFERPKKGFEVPLQKWMEGPLKSIFEEAVNDNESKPDLNLFNQLAINELKDNIYSNNPMDSARTAWAFIVFQTWYKKYME